MKFEVKDDEVSQWSEFWAVCTRLITVYPIVHHLMSGDAEAKQLERQLKVLGTELLSFIVRKQSLVGRRVSRKGNWLRFHGSHFSTLAITKSAQQGVYPVIHLSTEAPIGIRLGLGVSAKAFRVGRMSMQRGFGSR